MREIFASDRRVSPGEVNLNGDPGEARLQIGGTWLTVDANASLDELRGDRDALARIERGAALMRQQVEAILARAEQLAEQQRPAEPGEAEPESHWFAEEAVNGQASAEPVTEPAAAGPPRQAADPLLTSDRDAAGDAVAVNGASG